MKITHPSATYLAIVGRDYETVLSPQWRRIYQVGCQSVANDEEEAQVAGIRICQLSTTMPSHILRHINTMIVGVSRAFPKSLWMVIGDDRNVLVGKQTEEIASRLLSNKCGD